jgi:hypothetical protein
MVLEENSEMVLHAIFQMFMRKRTRPVFGFGHGRNWVETLTGRARRLDIVKISQLGLLFACGQGCTTKLYACMLEENDSGGLAKLQPTIFRITGYKWLIGHQF